MVKLFCAIVGDGVLFSVRVDDTEFAKDYSVDELKNAIKATKPTKIKCDAVDLQLFLAKKGGAWLNGAGAAAVTLDGVIPVTHDENGNPQGFEQMDPSLWLNDGKYFGDFHPAGGQVHVLVVPPVGATRAESTRQDCSAEWLKGFLSNEVKLHLLPPVASLEEFIKQALPVKIPMESMVLSAWSMFLDKNDQEKLFTTDTGASCEKIKKKIENMLDPLRSGDTESSFIWFWDTMIRALLDFVFISARFNRDSSKNSSTKRQRPDFLFLLHDICVFRGEEKEPGVDIRVPREELCHKLVWIYGTVPYLFAYAASGYKIDLFALVRDTVMSSNATSVCIGRFDLERGSDRFRFVLALLNLCLLFTAISEACPDSAKSEYQIFKRSGGVEVRLYPTLVKKIFPNAASLDHLAVLYDVLKTAEVPNVDRMKQLKPAKRMIVLEPRGISNSPSDLLELFIALRNVLEALVVLHRVSWIHRDIRWSNVIKRRDCDTWFLIDFTDSASSPQTYPSGDHLSKEEHAPEIFVKGGTHTTAVDMWAVGYLVETSDVGWDESGERSAFLMRLMQEDPTSRPTADEALHDVVELEEAAKLEQEAARELQQGDPSRNSRRSRTQSRKRTHP